jgi:hypothetical protein
MVNMSLGLSICGTASYFPSMPPVTLALFGAEIDKAYLRWLDVSKLLAAFPQQVKALGDIVTFQGPVAIVTSMGPIRRIFIQCLFSNLSGVVSFVFLNVIISKKERLISSSFSDGNNAKLAILISKLAAYFLGFGVGFYLTGRYFPLQPGIYIFGQPSFHA